MIFVLSKLNVTLLALDYVFEIVKTSRRQFWKLPTYGCEIVILIPSTKSIGMVLELVLGDRLVICMRKGKGLPQ
jgi:hypothetical protein